MDHQERIARFEHMVQADPDNDMAHFSLGGAYAQANRHEDAAREYMRCVEINPDMSKAYQLAGAEFIKAGQEANAADILTSGFAVAAAKGDLMPRNAIEALLKQIGRPVPDLDDATGRAADDAAARGSFVCRRTGRAGSRLPEPPLRGAIGQWIFENISAETWRAWIGQGTKVINELRLDFSKEKDQEAYDKHMREYLGIDDDLYNSLQR